MLNIILYKCYEHKLKQNRKVILMSPFQKPDNFIPTLLILISV